MNSRTLIALLAALGILVALAVAVSISQRPAATGGGLLLPELKAQINDIDRIVVRTGGDKTVATLVRGEAGWTLTERNGYAADVGRIRKNLIALAEASILEEKTSNPELYGRLKVEDIDKAAAGGVQLDLGAGEKTTSIVIGSTGVGGGDRAYARRAGEATSWLVSGSFDVPRETNEWLDRALTDVDAARVHAVTVRHPDGATVRVEKPTPEAVDFTVQGVPAGRELAYPGVGNAMGAALSDLTFDSVEPAAAFAPGDARPTVARFETFDGLVVEARSWRLPAGLRLRFTASADAAIAKHFAPPAASATRPPPDGATTGASAGQSAPDTATTGEVAARATAEPDTAASGPQAGRQKPFEDVQVEADQLNVRLGNWVYSVPDFKAEQFTKKLEDLLQPKTPKR